MGRLIKLLLGLIVLFVLAVVGFGLFGDMSAPTVDVSKPVVIDVD